MREWLARWINRLLESDRERRLRYWHDRLADPPTFRQVVDRNKELYKKLAEED